MKGVFRNMLLLRLRMAARRLLVRLGLLPSEGVHYIGGSDILPPPLGREEERALIARLGEGDAAAKSKLIERNLRLVVYIARRFENTGVGIEDLISIGTIGLIKAVGTYRAEKNIKLATYASRCIENEILMYFRAQKRTAGELSLSETIDVDKDGNALSLMDVVSVDDTMLEDLNTKERCRALREEMARCLTEREMEILCARYGLDERAPETQREIAARCGISRSYISRIEGKAIAKLRCALGEKGV